ncbi:MAG: M3 family peptidase, partial [Myxococcales bacterium]|nr:M3 family peptidase [Myxococcales bacterium]
MTIVLAEVADWLAALEADAARVAAGVVTGKAAFERLAAGLERISDRLETTWGAVGHLLSVRNSDALRAAHDAVQPAVVQFSLRVGQSRPLCEAWRALQAPDALAALDAGQRRLVETNLRDAELAGVGLDGVIRDRFNAIQTELAEAATTFQNHVLDATKAWGLDFADAGLAATLPPSLRGLLAQMWSTAHADEAPATPDAGPWRVTLDGPVLVPFLQHCVRRDLRETVYRAHVQRASAGDHDNTPLVHRILALRHEFAGLLGYPDYAALSLATKMAPDAATARLLLDDLHTASRPAAERDLAELASLARDRGADEAADLRPWDVAFWAERLREARFDVTDEQLRPWFPLPRVLDGTFRLVERLFGVRIEAADGAAPVWHDDVR